MPSTRPDESAAERSIREDYDSPLERLRLLGSDDDEIAAFLDELEVRSPREREMLTEIARAEPLARPERFETDHRLVIVSLESLRRHGFHGTRAGARLDRAQIVVRFLVELVARYLVIAHVKDVAMSLRNLYWLRELESPRGSDQRELLANARADAQSLVEITRSRELGIPTFVLGGLLVPAALSLWRLASGFTFQHWWIALVVGSFGVAVGLAISWIVLRGAALASRRIRLSVREPLRLLWETVGHCGRPPRDRSRRFTIVAISLTLGVWIVLPLLVTISLATG